MISQLDLSIDTIHSESLLESLGMTKLNHHDLSYNVYELNETVYYFEEMEDSKLRLFCKTTKNSFYLS